MKKFTAIIIGAGGRGAAYAEYMKQMPDKFEVVGVAEPIEARREYIAKLHNIPADRVFADWRELLALPKIGIRVGPQVAEEEVALDGADDVDAAVEDAE